MIRNTLFLLIALMSISLHAMENKIQLSSAQELRTRLHLHNDFVRISMIDYHLGGKVLSTSEVVAILEKSLDEYDEYCGKDAFVAKMMQVMKKSILQSILQTPLEDCEKLLKECAQKK